MRLFDFQFQTIPGQFRRDCSFPFWMQTYPHIEITRVTTKKKTNDTMYKQTEIVYTRYLRRSHRNNTTKDSFGLATYTLISVAGKYFIGNV